MKQNLLKTMFLLCALVAGMSSAWATDVTFTFNTDAGIAELGISKPNTSAGSSLSTDAYIKNGVSLTATHGSTNTRVWNSSGTLDLRIYKSGGSLTFSASGNKITQIVLAGSAVGNFTADVGAFSAGTWTGKAESITLTATNTGKINTITVTYETAVAGATASPSISGTSSFLDNTTVTITNDDSADGADIYYTLNGDDPTTTTSATCFAYSAPFTVDATTTVKAIAKKSTDTNASSVTSKTFTKITPITVAAAIAAIDASSGTTGVYVKGHITQIDSYESDKYITYWIADDGLTTDQFEVYRGLGIDGASFSGTSDLRVGDEVVVTGDLQKYQGVYEFKKDNQLVQRTTKTTPTFSLDKTELELASYGNEAQDVNLTETTDGEITCESSNADVATVVLKSAGVYTITAQSEGTATITIKSAPTATYAAAKATVSVTVSDTRAAAGISFAAASVTKTWGESYSGQELTNENSLDVTWSSTDETVATVNASGVVTVLKVGETTIKATFDGDETYKTAVASYTLTVNKAEANLSYETTSFDIELNDESFVAPTLNNPNGLTVTYASDNTAVAVVDENTGELLYEASAEGTAKITATFVGNENFKSGSANYTINIYDPTKKGTKYNPYTVAEVIEMAPTSTSVAASGQSDIYVTGYIVGEFRNPTASITTVLQSSFTTDANIAIADDPTTTALASSIPVNLTKTADQKAFGNKTNSGLTIGYKVLVKGNALKYFGVPGFKNIDEISAVSVPATFNASGYATFASTYALDFSDDSEFSAWQITEANAGSGKITFNQITDAVEAGTGVLLKGTASAKVNIPVAASGDDISSTNKLVGITASTSVSDDTYYGLSGNTFLKVNAGTVKPGKALLPVSAVTGAGAKAFTFVFNDASAIDTVREMNVNDGAIYNLAGQKMQKLQKGINIVNGKKIFVK